MTDTTKTICSKCRGPISVINGQYICAICGAIQGNVEAPKVSKNYSNFFEKTDEFRKLNRRLANTVVFCDYVDEKNNDDRAVYIIAPLSNGQFYTRFIKQVSGGCNYIYRGQCAVENWNTVKRIFADEECSVAIGNDGKLQPTLIEVEELFNRIKNSGISDMRMKQIIEYSYQHSFTYWGEVSYIEDTFLGLDINGKVVIYNPYNIFDLDEECSEDHDACLKLIKDIKNFPPLEQFNCHTGIYVGITAEGKVYAASHYDDRKKLVNALSKWDNIDSILSFSCYSDSKYNKESSTDEIIVGLKKDGTLISCEYNQYSDEVTSYKGKSAIKRYLGKDFNQCEEIVQIAIININGNEDDIGILTSNGEFICGNTKISDNVIAIFSHGYIHVDGSVYELVCKSRGEYKPISGLKLFDSAGTADEEYEAIEKNKAFFIDNLNKEKQLIICNLKKERENLNSLKTEYSNLGFFKAKEKKHFVLLLKLHLKK